jgi:hypothetical protein
MDIQRRSLFKLAAGTALCITGASFLTKEGGILTGLWRQMRYGLWMHATPVRNPDIVAENRGSETILHSRSREAAILKLNATAGYIWTRCDGSRKLQDIVYDVSRRFDVTPARCGRDVLLTALNLRNRGLLLS